jgi:Ca2+-binding RTX toxin-like protein
MSAYATGEVEILTLTGLALVGIGNGTNNTITGNGGINTIHGGGGNDTIDGGAGADTMYGDAGDDTFIVDSLLDVVIETAGGGTADLIKAGFTYTLGDSSQPNNQVENLTLTGIAKINGTGNALANIITGNGAVNTLDGGLGADTYNGGGGYDTYMADIGGDTVLSGAGIVWASASYDMGAQAISIADLKMLAGCTVGTGNALANNIYTNNGICTVNGGAGNDTIYLHNDQDVVLDANAGVPETDTIIIDTTSYVTSGPGTASYDMSLYATGVRALTITGGGAFNVTCGDLPGGGPSPVPMGVTITGNSGVNTIMGGSGDDTFFVDAKDFVSGTGGGSDTVAVSFTLSLLADQALAVSHWVGIENITLTGSLIGNLTGDLLVNTLTGNAGTNIINDGGYGGALFAGDTLIGGGGNDTYYVNNTSDIVDEQHNGGGLDLVISTVSFDMSGTVSDSVDRLTLTGSALYGIGNSSTNTITGNALDNTIDGGAGSDTMIGGLGSDTYYVDSSDTIIDSGGLHDLVIVQKASYILPTGIEDATLEPGIIATSLTGNSAVNVLIGNTLDNMIDGKLGADTMIGGDGNDIYFVDNLGDVVTEQIGEGTDQITTTINYSLASIANVENLEVHDPARIGYGNALDNHIFSCGCTAAANTLAGNAGSDWLEGKTGNDILYAENAPGQPVVTDSAFDINTLDGGLGKDTLYCGQGIDTVVCNPDATTNVDIVYNFQKSGGDNILFESALIGFDPLQNVLDDFVAHRQVSANLEYVYIDRDGIGNAYHFQLALILNEIP